MKKATKINLTLLALALSANGLYAQQGFGTKAPNKASVIDMTSATKGLLVPRVALTSTAVFAPVSGVDAANQHTANSLLVYNTATTGSGNTAVSPGYYYWQKPTSGSIGTWKRLLANDDASALALAGDVTGTLGANVVGKIQGIPVTNTTPTNNQVLTYNGTAWTPAAISPATITGKGTLTTQGGIEFTGSTNGTDKLLGNATIQIADLGVTTAKLAADAVTNAKLADNAVQTENIADRNVTAAKLTAGTGSAGRVAVADANGVVTYTNAVPSSSVSGQDVTATSNKVTLGGTPAGAALKAFSIDVNEANLTLNNIGGTLNANKITPGTNGQVLTTNGSGATVWADKSSLITAVSNTSSGNLLTTTVNGTTGSAVNIINSNGLSLNTSNQLVSTVNGVASTALDLTPAVKANQQNTIVQGTGAISVPAAVTSGNNTTYTVGVNTATASALGVVRPGTGLSINSGVLSVDASAAGIGKTLTGSGVTVTAGNTVGTGTSLANTVLADVTLGIADNAITSTKIANNAVTVGKLPAGASATTFLRGDGTWVTPTNTTYTGSTSVTLNGTSFERAALTGDVTAPANSNVTTIADGVVNSAKIENGSIQGEDLNTNVAGNGLTQAASGALQVNANNGLTVDGTADAVQLGGSLNKPTTITTTATNTLTLAGLQSGAVSDKIVVSDANGVLKTVDSSSLVSANQRTTTVVAGNNVSVSPAAPNATGNTAYAVSVPTATVSALGVVQPGTGLSINSGVISVDASATGIGKTLTGSGITVTAGSTVGTGTSVASSVLADVTLGIADNAITNTKIADNAVTVSKLPTGATNTTFLRGDGTWVTPTDTNTTYTGSTSITLSGTSFQRAALTGDVTAAANSNATTIANNAITTVKIANDAVTAAKINPDVAGIGLTQATNGSLDVNANNGLTVDSTTDAVQLGGSLNKPTTITTTAANTLAIGGLQTGTVADRSVVADANGVLKTVKQAPRFFYMPAVIFDTSVSGTFTRDLYTEYAKQFQGNSVYITGENNGTAIGAAAQQIQYTGGIISSDTTKPTIAVYTRGELTYYITYYDQTAFSAAGLSIASDGRLTYTVQNNAPAYAYMNIVFVVNE